MRQSKTDPVIDSNCTHRAFFESLAKFDKDIYNNIVGEEIKKKTGVRTVD